MPLVSVRCQNCGAPLEVVPEARFITCGHCSSQLEFHHNSTASFTTLLEKLDKDFQETAHDVKILKLEHELMRLDRTWEQEKEIFVETDSNGNRSLPHHGTAIVTYFFTAVIALIAFVYMFDRGANLLIAPLVALSVILVGRFIAKCQSLRATRYERLEGMYKSRRRALMQEIQNAQRN